MNDDTYLVMLYDGIQWRAVFGCASSRAYAEKKRDRLHKLGYPAVVLPTRDVARAMLGKRILESLEDLASATEQQES